MAIAFRTYTKGGHTYGGIVENYRDPATGKSRTKSLHRYGNLDKLRERNPNFMEEVEAELQRLRAEVAPRIAVTREAAIRAKAQSKFSAPLPPVPDTSFAFFSSPVKFGEIILRRQWEELELNHLFARIGTKLCYDLDAAAYYITVSRLLEPNATRPSFEAIKPSLFDYSQLSLDNLYEALIVVGQRKEQVIAWLNQYAKHDFSSGTLVLLNDVNFWEPGYNFELIFAAHGLPVDFELETCDDKEAIVQRWRERYGFRELSLVKLYDRELPHDLFVSASAFRDMLLYWDKPSQCTGQLVLSLVAVLLAQRCLNSIRVGVDPDFSLEQLRGFLRGSVLIIQPHESGAVLIKATAEDVKGKSVQQFDQILGCCGVEPICNCESVASVTKKFGVGLKLSRLLTG